ncbi:hypothetical cytosolic protein [Trichinella spiralis]|uniref:hypothetical cytosolic protein n=1 Tax=Trichinella spiralis TaxID=6334 RepID=UPI0001EFEF58|nr:hypothetical cytosolic protein [Trichinella spiralis]
MVLHGVASWNMQIFKCSSCICSIFDKCFYATPLLWFKINASQKSTYLYSTAANPCDDRHLHRIDVLVAVRRLTTTATLAKRWPLNGSTLWDGCRSRDYLPLPLSFPCAVSTESLVAVRLTWKLWRSFTSAGRCGIMDVAG